ncbi:alpha-ketoglutarate-dependent dioxygenase AlkB [Streptomyces sp. NPDC025273]|uniref:alpha-ketoglutarate-dependent dioxygenase AlkB n=1 Tax=Streptomyces sp. NPDC025273 TaxID=3155251 RepID=UPI0034043B48
MRQDKEGRSGAPVVSLSLGHTCVFGFGNTRDRGRPCNDVEWVCGDLFVSGGPSRYAFHGSTKVFEATAGPASGMRARPARSDVARDGLGRDGPGRGRRGAGQRRSRELPKSSR